MVTFWITLPTVVAGLAFLVALLLGCQSWEHRRAARQRLQSFSVKSHAGKNSPRVALLAPCKGLDVGLKENLRTLFCQNYDNYELHFIVESTEDSAGSIIRPLMAEHPHVESHLVIAGRVTDTGQKVHNLRVATGELTSAVELLAFVDSDARPGPDWLGSLLDQLDRPRAGIVTGYRWFVPQRPTWANCLLHSINATSASLYSPKGFNPVWGGSWAIRRELFERIGLREAWKGVLTDDLVATNLVRQANLRVEFEPACVLASPLDFSFAQMFNFLRRQYLIGRHYMPGMWGLTLLATTLGVFGFWGALIAAVVGGWLQAPGAWWPAAACALLYGCGMFRATIRRDLTHLYLPGQRHLLNTATWFDFWTTPLAAVVNWAAILSTVWGRQMVWRNVTYRLLPQGKTRITNRREETWSLKTAEPRQAWAGHQQSSSTRSGSSFLTQEEQNPLRPSQRAA
jgi:ceramide glucosyltransferase